MLYNQVLYSLCCHLKDDHCLRSIHLICEFPRLLQPPWESAGYDDFADPLCLLGSLKHIVMEAKGASREMSRETYRGRSELSGIELPNLLALVQQARFRMRDLTVLTKEGVARHGTVYKYVSRAPGSLERLTNGDPFRAFNRAVDSRLHPMY